MSQDLTEQWNAQLAAVRARVAGAGLASLEDLRARSGAEFFRAMGNGQLPMPHIGETLEFWPVEWEVGRMVFQGTPHIGHYNPIRQPKVLEINGDRARYWLGVGAQPTETVATLLKRVSVLDESGKLLDAPAAEA